MQSLVERVQEQRANAQMRAIRTMREHGAKVTCLECGARLARTRDKFGLCPACLPKYQREQSDAMASS